jgi:hypothetical protein
MVQTRGSSPSFMKLLHWLLGRIVVDRLLATVNGPVVLPVAVFVNEEGCGDR